MFGEKFFRRKEEEPKKSVGPSFKELAMLLPEDEKNELIGLESVPTEIATIESEHGLEIEYDKLSEQEKKLYDRYITLYKKASNLFEQKKQSGNIKHTGIEDMPVGKKGDSEREIILKKVKEHFLKAIEGYEESPMGESPEDTKDVIKLHSALDDMDRDDYTSAHEYLTEEIERLSRRIVEVSDTEVGREYTTPNVKKAIQELEALRDSLLLSEE